eukprot:TRINITY_DN44631_c0_g1_i1.p1 TRINITY_DN44631_c0_g1~~TRINITY_DN44631_c0_g1_i1.p1  ORF type:complete len:116 (+),score=23.80 TRINITY_DN44631_c0_g1_i1:74-421(+)
MSWLPAGKYVYDGKDVLKITNWDDATGRDIWKVHFADGTVHQVDNGGAEAKTQFNALIEQFGFKKYPYSSDGGMCRGLDACPEEDPAEFEEQRSGPPQCLTGHLRTGVKYTEELM